MHIWKSKEVTKLDTKVLPGQCWRKKGTQDDLYSVEQVSNGRVYTTRLSDKKTTSFCIMNFRRHWHFVYQLSPTL